MNEPDLGQVVWMDVTDPQGNAAGEHAVIVLTTKVEHANGKPLIGVVVSTKLHHSAPESRVMMKSQKVKGGHPRTKFTKKCAAMCDWIVGIDARDIRRYGGLVYGEELKQVLLRVKATQAEQPE